MNWAIVVFIVMAIFVGWLVVDTIIYTIKKVKEKKSRKNKEVEVKTDSTDKVE